MPVASVDKGDPWRGLPPDVQVFKRELESTGNLEAVFRQDKFLLLIRRIEDANYGVTRVVYDLFDLSQGASPVFENWKHLLHAKSLAARDVAVSVFAAQGVNPAQIDSIYYAGFSNEQTFWIHENHEALQDATDNQLALNSLQEDVENGVSITTAVNRLKGQINTAALSAINS